MGTIFPVQILHQVLFPSIKVTNEGNFPNPANHRSYLLITEFNVYHDATGIWSDWRGNDEFEKQKTYRPYHRRTGLHGFYPWLACRHYCLWISTQLMALLAIAFHWLRQPALKTHPKLPQLDHFWFLVHRNNSSSTAVWLVKRITHRAVKFCKPS